MVEFKTAMPREINIRPTANGGFIVQTGCCTLCFADNQSLVAGLRQYLDDPEGHEKRYNEMYAGQGVTQEVP